MGQSEPACPLVQLKEEKWLNQTVGVKHWACAILCPFERHKIPINRNSEPNRWWEENRGWPRRKRWVWKREREHFCKNFIKNQKKIGQSFRGPRCLFFFLTGEQVSWNHYPKDIYIIIHIQKNIINDKISAISATSAKIRHIQDNREQNR